MTPAKLLALKSLMLQNHPHAAIIIDRDFQVLFTNEKTKILFALDSEVNSITELFAHVLNKKSVLEIIESAFKKAKSTAKISVFRNEKELHLEIYFTVVQENSEPKYLLINIIDDSASVRLQRRMTQEEFMDRPTGLFSRKTLDVMIDIELDKAARDKPNSKLAIIMIFIRNLEHLKSVYSSDVVNLIMEHIGNAIRNALRLNDLLFRFDDTRILIIANTFKLTSDLLIISERIEEQISMPFHAQDATIHLQSTIGISIYPHDGESSDSLIGNAITALNHALEEGNPWLMYNREIHDRSLDRLYLRSGLSDAVNNRELELRYMSIVDREGKICGVEALIRWNHPTRGLLGPDVFIPVAVHSKIIGALTRFVLFSAVEDWAQYFKKYDIFLTCNLSALDFEDNFLIETLEAAILGKIPAQKLKLEITEHECIEKIDRAIILINQMKDLGIEVLIDDFGIGNSSLSYLRDLPAQWAKIDRSFIHGITESPLEQVFLNHVISLGKLRNMDIIIEGVENDFDFETLKKTEASYFQGHLFGSPMTLADIIRKLEEGKNA